MKLEIINYLLTDGDIENAKSWRTQLFFSVINMALQPGHLSPFEITLDPETMINLTLLHKNTKLPEENGRELNNLSKFDLKTLNNLLMMRKINY